MTNSISVNMDNMHATRDAFGETLSELKASGKNVVAVDADLAGSTTTKKFAGADANNEKYLIDCGIAEQNMIDVAAGLSLTGYTAFTGSFAVFGCGRTYDQIRNTVCYSNLNVKICPTHSGISVGPDGGSHQMIEDLALMQVLPNMKVLVPADYMSAKAAIRTASVTPGPVYVRMGREKLPQIYGENFECKLGGSNVIQTGEDCVIVACGLEVFEAIKAAEILMRDGISVTIINAYSIKPLDVDTICKHVSSVKRVVVCEEHSIYGGLGSSVAQALLNNGINASFRQIAVDDKFGTSGNFSELMREYKLDAAAIEDAVKSLIV